MLRNLYPSKNIVMISRVARGFVPPHYLQVQTKVGSKSICTSHCSSENEDAESNAMIENEKNEEDKRMNGLDWESCNETANAEMKNDNKRGIMDTMVTSVFQQLQKPISIKKNLGVGQPASHETLDPHHTQKREENLRIQTKNLMETDNPKIRKPKGTTSTKPKTPEKNEDEMNHRTHKTHKTNMKRRKKESPQVKLNRYMKRMFYENKVELAMEAFQEFESFGRKPDELNYNTLIESLARANKLNYAINALKKAKEEEVEIHQSVYSSIIYCYEQNESWEDLISLYEEMEREGIEIDDMTAHRVLTAFIRTSKYGKAEEFYLQQKEKQPVTFKIRGITMYIIANQIQKAAELILQEEDRAVVQTLIRKVVLHSISQNCDRYAKVLDIIKVHLKNDVLYPTLIVHVQRGNIEKAKEIFAEMDNRQIATMFEDLYHFTTEKEVLGWLIEEADKRNCPIIRNKNLEKIANIFNSEINNLVELIQNGSKVSPTLIDAKLYNLFNKEKFDEVSQLLLLMEEKNIPLSPYAYRIKLSQIQCPNMADDIFKEMVSKNIDFDKYIYKQFTKIYSLSEKFSKVLDIYAHSKEKNVHLLSSSYDDVIKAAYYEKRNMIPQIWNEMQFYGIKPHPVAITYWISYLLDQERIQEAIECSEQLSSFKIGKDLFRKVIQLFCRKDRVYDAWRAYTKIWKNAILDEIGIETLFFTLIKHRMYNHITELLKNISNQGFPSLELKLRNAAIKQFCSIGDVNRAIQTNLKMKSCKPDVHSFKPILEYYMFQKNEEQVKYWMNMLHREGIVIDEDVRNY